MLLADEDDEHYCVPLDAMLLAHADPVLHDTLIKFPKATLELLEQAAYTAQVCSSRPQTST